MVFGTGEATVLEARLLHSELVSCSFRRLASREFRAGFLSVQKAPLGRGSRRPKDPVPPSLSWCLEPCPVRRGPSNHGKTLGQKYLASNSSHPCQVSTQGWLKTAVTSFSSCSTDKQIAATSSLASGAGPPPQNRPSTLPAGTVSLHATPVWSLTTTAAVASTGTARPTRPNATSRPLAEAFSAELASRDAGLPATRHEITSGGRPSAQAQPRDAVGA